MTPTAPLDCTSAVIIIPIIPNIHKFISLYCPKSNTLAITSILSFKKSIHKKNNPKPINSFAQYHRYLLLVTSIITQPIAIKGRAKADILNSPNHKNQTINHVAVDPIFAPTKTPTALTNAIIPVLTNHRVRREMSVLLLSIPVIIVPVVTAFHPLSVYFCRIKRSLGPPSFLMASSNISIPKRTRPNPAHNIHRFILSIVII